MFKYLKRQLHLKLSTYSRDTVEVHEYPNALEAEAKEENATDTPVSSQILLQEKISQYNTKVV